MNELGTTQEEAQEDDDGETIELLVESSGGRLDRFIAEAVETLSRSHVRKLLDEGHVLLNRQPCKPSHSVARGDTITIWCPPPQPTALVAEDIPLDVVYEDDHIVIINKASGMVVHPAPGHSRGTLVNALLARYPDLSLSGDIRPGIVHRLDQDTSGLMVIARNDHAMQHITAQQKARTMHKAYLAVVEGRFREPAGVIDAPIARHPNDRKKQAIVANGREARTHYRVVEELGMYTLVEAILETGRTHQIRVHMAYQHHPVLADSLYGPRKPRSTYGLKRQFLHAYKLGFRHPTSNEWSEWTIPLPTDLETVLQKLRHRV